MQAGHGAPGGDRSNPCGPLGNRESQGAAVFSGGLAGSLPLPSHRSFGFSRVQAGFVLVSEYGSGLSQLSGPFSDSSSPLHVFKSVPEDLVPNAALGGM